MTSTVETAPPRRLRDVIRSQIGASWSVAAVNFIVLAAACAFCWLAIDWAIVSAVWPWRGGADCVTRSGACWPFLVEKVPLILFGAFPYVERWRPGLVSVGLLVMSLITLFQWVSWRWQALGWIAAVGLFGLLMGGGALGLARVPSSQWNGLPVLLFLGAASLACAMPVGLALALGRRSSRVWLARLCVVVVETLRGVPMVSVLFFGVFVLPLLVPGLGLSPVYAALAVLIAFHGAYVAEDLRAGFLAVPVGQWDGCKAVGLTHWASLRLVILPQVLKAATPALTNTAIGGFKDTSLIVLVGLHDLVSTAKMAFGDSQWQKQALEAYVFVGLIYFVVSRCIAAAGARFERLQRQG